MSLEWLVKSKVGYFRGPATVGLIKGASGWIFIDTGVDADVPKKVIKALLEDLGESRLAVSAIINTHAHADHVGGNAYLQKNYDAKTFSSLGEKPYIENPSLEPHYLFSGEAPKALHNKFFEAKPSVVHTGVSFLNDKGIALPVGTGLKQAVDEVALTFIRLPGHSKEMIGVLTPEGYFFCGDLLFPKIILEKHPMLFLHDSKLYIEALKWALDQQFKGVILTHGGYFEDHLTLANDTKELIQANQGHISAILTEPLNEWEIHNRLAQQYGLNEGFGDWHLNHGVVRSYLAEGLEKGNLKWENGLYCPVSI